MWAEYLGWVQQKRLNVIQSGVQTSIKHPSNKRKTNFGHQRYPSEILSKWKRMILWIGFGFWLLAYWFTDFWCLSSWDPNPIRPKARTDWSGVHIYPLVLGKLHLYFVPGRPSSIDKIISSKTALEEVLLSCFGTAAFSGREGRKSLQGTLQPSLCILGVSKTLESYLHLHHICTNMCADHHPVFTNRRTTVFLQT